MTEKKNSEKKIDNFDYESINEDSIANENIEEKSFKMNKVETARFYKFKENHHKCLFDESGHSKFGCSGGGLYVSFENTGLGSIVICNCSGCKASVNITDFDSW